MVKKFKSESVSVILPTRNEKGNISLLIRKIIACIRPVEILVVDDDSSDGTQNEVRKLLRRNPCLRLLVNKPPLGLTPSIQKGIDESKGNIVAWMDADLSHPPEILEKMLHKIRGRDIVTGSWLAKGGRDERRELLVRFFSYSVNCLCRFLFNKQLTAYTSGFIMARRNVLNGFRLKGDYGEYCIDFLVRISAKNYGIKEIPFICRSRYSGTTKTSPDPFIYFRRGLKYLKTVFSLSNYFFKL